MTGTDIEYIGLGHVCIIVNNIEEATKFYQGILGAIPVQSFPHFRNMGFSKSAGFLESPGEVDVSIRFLIIPGTTVTIELMEYHNPRGNVEVTYFKANDVSGIRHVALKVKNIEKAFEHIKIQKGIMLINASPEYKPFKIDNITPNEFYFHDANLENNIKEKEKVCKTIGSIKYFYFIDMYGVQWEFEEGHSDIGD